MDLFYSKKLKMKNIFMLSGKNISTEDVTTEFQTPLGA